MSGAPLVVFAGGGTGGHLFPPLAVASALRLRVPDVRFAFLGTDRAIDRRILDGSDCQLIPQPVQPLRARSPWTYPGFLAAWIAARRRCRSYFAATQPVVVVGTGGFASGPGVVEARRAGIPTALINPDVIPGRANRYLASRADMIFAQWDEAAAYFGNHPAVKITGCPVRPEFQGASRQAGLSRFGLDDRRKTLLVTGASQGARSLNNAVLAILDDLTSIDGWQLLLITGATDQDRVSRAWASRVVVGAVVPFTEHMADALAAADLVVARAGGSTLAEITALGRPSVLMPYPHHRDRHQEANARVLETRGAAKTVEDKTDSRENAASLRRVLVHLMTDDALRTRMAEEARRLGRKDAAGVIASEIIDLSRGALRARTSRV
ncbi:MAG: UDP-N-acetylglucosamine--N-acetylmuramyl-(pentapeptide) pyrophosphoryl-undecaprenol N-acetylglucosamine transferase [Phycisphaerales bacterium]|nr:MAG: UDP-N-acetylglucosamine--N-acetylmuramyl-(pentapeptide) pyrophosphoryl-undecaprenol N-acetylglucosamine transferase [Phycisphaerales bacterium]